MFFVSNKVRCVITGFIVSLLGLSPLMADDTEIYVGSNLGVTNAAPNILFLVDTSGSMRSLVTTQVDYDPAVTYSGCFSTSRVYWKTNTSDPGCSTSRYFNLSALKCQAALDQFTTTGFLNDSFARYDGSPGTWAGLATGGANIPVECRADSGVHGDGGSGVYAANESNGGPWSTNSADEINWNLQNAYTISSGNYENWKRAGVTVDMQRLEIVKDSIKDLINSISGVNIGLMQFDYWEGGSVTLPVRPLTTTTKDEFLYELYRMYPGTWTPLSELLYESALYYGGKNVDYGGYFESFGAQYALNTTQTPYTGPYDNLGYYDGISASYVWLPSHDDSRTPSGGNQYKSPIDSQCQKNFVILLTDGEPSYDDGINNARLGTIGANSCDKAYLDYAGAMKNNCLPQIAEAMANNDQSSSFTGDQTVTTYTIGFATDQILLGDAAQKGKGEYFTADDSASLATVFSNIIVNILSTSATFSSPAVSVNAFNRTAHRSDLYFTLFKPSNGPHWDGNFKRYKLAFKLDGSPEIVDVNDDPAVDNGTGFFKDSAISYWTTSDYSPDGKEAGIGGVASRFPGSFNPARNIYTNLSSADSLTDANNAVHEDNTGYLTAAVLGTDPVDTAYRTKLLQWARGIDVDDDDNDGSTTDARVIMGDPLHSQPALIQYDGPESDPEIIAYVATNDGYLHAIDTRKAYGTEKFAFIPNDLLNRLDVFYKDSNSVSKPYGIDGSVVAWVDDKNSNGIIEPTNGDHAYIYFGMRRGGNNMYAMDVTNPASPEMLWANGTDISDNAIKGGSTSFSELSQSWSRPVLRKIRVNGVETQVLVFAGGYDINQDGSSLRSTDTIGRAIYMVNAKTGERIWWAAHDSNTTANIKLSEMQYSIPADLSAIDVNADGFLDVIYAADTGGQIFRFDFPGSEVNNALGGRIAELASNTVGTGQDAAFNSRRFYYPPDVAIINNKDRIPSLALAINSGYRAHPNNLDTQDRIYMIRDKFPISGVTPTYSTITESDLYDATDNLIGADGDTAQNATALGDLNSKQGWFIDLEDTGEKGLGKPFIFENVVFVSTFVPSTGTTATCAPTEGSSFLYVMSLFDAQPKFLNGEIVDDSSTITKSGRRKDLNQSGIGGDPKLIMQPSQNDTICVGTECMGVKGLGQLRAEYWFEQ